MKLLFILTKEKHQLSDFQFMVIEQIWNIDNKDNVDKRLLRAIRRDILVSLAGKSDT